MIKTVITLQFVLKKAMEDRSSLDGLRLIGTAGIRNAEYYAGIPHLASISFETREAPTPEQIAVATTSLHKRIRENYPGAQIIRRNEQNN